MADMPPRRPLNPAETLNLWERLDNLEDLVCRDMELDKLSQHERRAFPQMLRAYCYGQLQKTKRRELSPWLLTAFVVAGSVCGNLLAALIEKHP